jgi:hypothetical protein
MLKYYQAQNYGKGFITHEDNEFKHVAGYPGNIWVTENEIWAQRVGATELTKDQAQSIVDQAIEEYNQQIEQQLIIQQSIILP